MNLLQTLGRSVLPVHEMVPTGTQLPIGAVVLGLCLLLPSIAFGQGEQFRGEVVTEEGQTRIAEQFLNLRDELTVRYRGSLTEIPMTEIKSVIRVEEGEGVLIITNREGKKFKAEGEMGDMTEDGEGYFSYSAINPATGDYSETTAAAHRVKKVVFGEDYGSLRRCPDGGRTFPPDYVFCPYHKTKLKLVQVGK